MTYGKAPVTIPVDANDTTQVSASSDNQECETGTNGKPAALHGELEPRHNDAKKKPLQPIADRAPSRHCSVGHGE